MKTRRSATWALGLVLATTFNLGAQNAVPAAPAATPKSEPPKTPVLSPAPAQSVGSVLSAATPARTAISPWFEEIAKMTEAGIGPQALLAFVDSAGTFNLTADQIIYLHQLGAPSGLITAMLQHDLDITSGVLPLPATAVPKLPPPLKMIAVKTNAAPTVAAAKPAPKAAQVNPAPAEPTVSEAQGEEDWDIDYTPVVYEPLAVPGFSPVRKPYAVPLTDPIVIVQAPERMPNVISISMH